MVALPRCMPRVRPTPLSPREHWYLHTRSQAPPGNAVPGRLRLPGREFSPSLRKSRQSLDGSAFPGGAWERESPAKTRCVDTNAPGEGLGVREGAKPCSPHPRPLCRRGGKIHSLSVCPNRNVTLSPFQRNGEGPNILHPRVLAPSTGLFFCPTFFCLFFPDQKTPRKIAPRWNPARRRTEVIDGSGLAASNGSE